MILNFTFRAGRSYIEISQIVEKFLEAHASRFLASKIRNFNIRAHDLLTEDVEVIELNSKNESIPRAAEIEFQYESVSHRFALVKTIQKVLQNQPDPNFDGALLLRSNDQDVWLNETEDYSKFFWCYVLMRQMREFGDKLNQAKKTIAVEIQMSRFPDSNEIKSMKIKTKMKRRMGFATGKVFLGVEEVGQIKIRL